MPSTLISLIIITTSFSIKKSKRTSNLLFVRQGIIREFNKRSVPFFIYNVWSIKVQVSIKYDK